MSMSLHQSLVVTTCKSPPVIRNRFQAHHSKSSRTPDQLRTTRVSQLFLALSLHQATVMSLWRLQVKKCRWLSLRETSTVTSPCFPKLR